MLKEAIANQMLRPGGRRPSADAVIYAALRIAKRAGAEVLAAELGLIEAERYPERGPAS